MTQALTVPTPTTGTEARAAAPARSAVATRPAACARVSGPVAPAHRREGTAGTARERRMPFEAVAPRYGAPAEHVRRHVHATPGAVAAPVVRGGADHPARTEREAAG
ncbi:divalent-cation tolerance protein CutA [Streptomyces sp. TRM76323]|uniref:Divalent-cation tolerance protein CutA n=1 Tax=Streptomyces tamarix TaxID=3078565 RepID=A0ABU3QR17_9ACTN|nr:divalent-cation tolerance protein CutA [Streptomyces tamarix]MDT9684943.1 divalent-cation tolerance protein CutA [Streptomyces tamarix]